MSRYNKISGQDLTLLAKRLKPLLNLGSGDTYQVKVSDDDTTPGYLSGKITSADASVAIAVANDAADEDLDLSVSVYVAAEIDDHAGDPDAHHDQVHVLATNAGLGADHTMSGATAGHVLRASSATAAAFAQLQHSDLGGVTANQHHNQSHVLASTSGLGADHTVSGLTAGQVLRATSSTAAAFASLQATDLPSHVLATNTALGSQHSISGATAGHVLRASGATAAAFAQLQHSDLGGVGANDHHNQSHVLATTSALGADHTVSGLTSGQVLRATGATTAAFGSLQATDLPSHVLATNTALGSQHTISGATAGHVLRASSATAANFQALAHSDLGGVGANDHHNQSHVLASASGLGADHTVSGLTARQVLVATGATTALFRALEDADIPASIARDSEVTSAISTHASDANAHHNRSHAITSASDHTVTGAALDVVGLTTTNTLGILTPSAAVSTAVSALLKTDSNGRVQVQGLGIGTAATGTGLLNVANQLLINSTGDANVTIGIVINQGANDDFVASFKSSDVDHNVTDRAETNTWGYIKKFVATGSEGGLAIEGLTEGNRAVGIVGTVTSEDTTRSTAAVGAVEIRGHTKSGTTVATMGANANVFVVKNNTGTQFLVDAEGDIHMNATSNINAWDDEDDMALINGLRGSLVPQLRERYGDLVRQMRPILEAGNIATFNDYPGGDGSIFLNVGNALLLTMDGLRQVNERVDGRLRAIERRLLDA